MYSEQDKLDAGIICRGLKIDGVEAMATILAGIRATLATPDSNGRLRDLDFTLKRSLRQLREIEHRKLVKRKRVGASDDKPSASEPLTGF